MRWLRDVDEMLRDAPDKGGGSIRSLISGTDVTTQTNSGSIELSDLVKAYDDEVVLEGIDLHVEAGEFLVIVGPSGCGKSTLLRCVAGLETITDGRLHIDGHRCNDVEPRDRDLAMVFQSYALYPHMTVEENLAFSLTVRDMPDDEIRERVDRAAERLDIEELLDRQPGQLSGGQQQRVALGRAIVRDPKAFLMDEPLSNLDAALRSNMRIELKKLHRDLDATLLYVTHDQVEAMTLADRIAILDDGELQQVGTPREVFDTPANQFVAGFIGSPSMNFLEARCDPERLAVAGDDFDFELPGSHADLDVGREVVAGVRPSALALGGGESGELRGDVEVVEPLGSESYLHLRCGGTEVVAEVPTDALETVEPGDTVTCSVAPGDVHLFDTSTGRALGPERGGESSR
jgi:multiple sugar transport system ATP-binding protein